MCSSCIYNIANEAASSCFACQLPTIAGVCKICSPTLPFTHAYIVGQREKELKKLLNDFKFNRVYQIHTALAQLLDQKLPILAKNTIIIPVPTIPRHIRVRGYDHTDLIAKALAKQRGLQRQKLLQRKTSSIQLGASAQQRKKQAAAAYECRQSLDPNVPYLLIDDIVTTGATMKAAARCLKKAGATQIIVAAIARQML